MKQLVLQWLTQHAERVDRLSQRERIFLFISVLVVLVAMADTLWLTPAMDAQRKMVQRFSAQTQEINQLRGELQTAGLPGNVAGSARDEIAKINAQLDTLEQDVHRLAPSSLSGNDLEKVLVQFLRKQERLTLLGTGTLTQDPARRLAAVVSPETAPGAVLPDRLFRQGMELRVMGPYTELLRYLKTLESALPGLRWGRMNLRSEGPMPVLTLQVFVVGVRP